MQTCQTSAFIACKPHTGERDRNAACRRLRGFKCVGAYVGADEWAINALSTRLARLDELLAKIGKLHDTDKVPVALQVQLNLLKHCANTVPNYWLRTMPPHVVDAAAKEHDARIGTAFAVATDFDTADSSGTHAALQATLPVRMGGFGLSAMASIAPAAYTASLAANLATIVSLAPSLAHLTAHAAATEDRPLLPAIAALQLAHSTLLRPRRAAAPLHRVGHAAGRLRPARRPALPLPPAGAAAARRAATARRAPPPAQPPRPARRGR